MIEGCSGHFPLDLLFALPDQAGIDDTAVLLKFIKSVTGDLVISPVQVQVGMTPRLCSLKKAIQLNANDNFEGFLVSMDERQLSGTRTDNQLKYMRQEGFARKNGARVQSVKFGILVVDNKSVDRAKTMAQAALAKDDMQLIVIGVGDHVDRSELQKIASSDDNVHFVDNYSGLSRLVTKIVHTLCDALMKDEPTPLSEDEFELLGMVSKK